MSQTTPNPPLPVTPLHGDFQQRQAAMAPDVGSSSASSSPASTSPHRPRQQAPAMLDSSSAASSLASGALTPATSIAGSSPVKRGMRSSPSPSSLKNGSGTASSSSHHAPAPLDLPAAVARANGDPLLALQHVLAERNQLAGENAQLWKLLDKQRDRVAVYKAERDAERHKRHQQHQQQLQAAGQPQLQPRVQSLQGNATTSPHLTRTGSPLASPASPVADGSPRPAHASRALLFDSQSDADAGPSVPAPAAARYGGSMDDTDQTPVKHRRTDSGSLLPSALVADDDAQRRQEASSSVSFDPDVKHYLSMMATPQGETFSGTGLGMAPAGGDEGDDEALARLLQMQALSDSQVPPPPPERAPTHLQPQQGPAADDPLPSSSRSSPSKPAPPPPYTQAPSQSVPSLTARTLPFVSCSILSSSMVTTPMGKDVPCITLRVTLKPPQTGRTYAWTLAKPFPAFTALDDAMRAILGNKKAIKQSGIASLPETKGWKDFAPTKLDQRKAAIEAYLQSILSAPIEDKSPLASFLTSDVRRESQGTGQVKCGYLTKKGKSLRGWKSRWFLLDGPLLHYFEQRGGPLLGSIQIAGAQIGTQHKDTAGETSDEKSYRHAFLILEAKRPGIGSATRHVLCAESDEERDGWVQILVRHVNGQYVSQADPTLPRPEMSRSETSSTVASDVSRPPNSRQASRDDVKIVRASAQPIKTMSQDSTNAKLFSGVNPSVINSREDAMARLAEPAPAFAESPISAPPSASWTNQDDRASTLSADSANRPTAPRRDIVSLEASPARRPISKPTAGVVIPPGAKFGQQPDRERERKARSMRIWGFGKPSAPEASRHVFGVPLEQALEVATIDDVPAIVCRCIAYLQTKNAHKEEGIFRLSGSTAVVKGLRDRFDADGDFDLLANDQRWDLHAIAGLLKMFLRELPTSILTKEMQMDFVRTNETPDRMERMPELARLITDLPEANFYLLRALCRHLTLVVANAALNKMTLRNIGIVFSPTLGIPAGLFSDMICHYRYIFDGDLADLQPIEEEVAARAAGGLVVPSLEPGPAPRDDDGPAFASAAANRRNRQSHVYIKPPAVAEHAAADLSAINEDEETIRDDVFLARD